MLLSPSPDSFPQPMPCDRRPPERSNTSPPVSSSPPSNASPPSNTSESSVSSQSSGHAVRLSEAPELDGQLVVERDRRIVRNVVLVGSQSRNGYRYRSEALSEAVGLYENKPVFLDHAEDPQQPRRRSARDLIGTLSGVRFETTDEGGRLRGDVRVLQTESGRTFLALAEAEGSGVGMSHVVLARRTSDGREVEAIEQVVSVDAVAFPATTTSFRERTEIDEPTIAAPPATGDSSESTRPSDHADGDSLAQWHGERDRLREQIAALGQQLAAERRRRRRESLLAEAALPAAALTEPFRRAVRTAESDEAAAALIADRRSLAARLDRGGHSEPRPPALASEATHHADAFVRAIRGC